MKKLIILAALLASCTTKTESFNYYHIQQADVREVDCYGKCCTIKVVIDGQMSFMRGSYVHTGVYKWATFSWYEQDDGRVYECTSHYGD